MIKRRMRPPEITTANYDGAWMVWPDRQYLPIKRLQVLASDMIANQECDSEWDSADIEELTLDNLITLLSAKYTFERL